MKIQLNLATRPYVELRPIYARLRLLMLIFVVLALPMLLVLRAEQAKARIATARVDQLKADIALLQAQKNKARALLQQPDNAGTLQEADFLNELFQRKAFSWTATMSDLEVTLPPGVQVLSIDPIVAPDGRVTIRLRVSGPRERAVEVVRNLEHSRHFIAPRLSDESLANQAGPGTGIGTGAAARQVAQISATGGSPTDVAFDILAEYRPLPNSHDKAGIAADRAAIPPSAALPAGTAVIEAPAPVTPAPGHQRSQNRSQNRPMTEMFPHPPQKMMQGRVR